MNKKSTFIYLIGLSFFTLVSLFADTNYEKSKEESEPSLYESSHTSIAQKDCQTDCVNIAIQALSLRRRTHKRLYSKSLIHTAYLLV